MKLSDAFVAVAHKRLAAVEVDPDRSNGHELNTGPGLRDFFGHEERAKAAVSWIRLAEDEIERGDDGTLTYYKAHRDPARNEWRIYYSGQPFVPTDEGDHVVLIRLISGAVVALIVPTPSPWHAELEALFGLELEQGGIRRGGARLGATLPQVVLETKTLRPRALLLLEELGIAIGSDAPTSDIDIVLERFGDGGVWPTTSQMIGLAQELAPDIDDPDDQLLAWLAREDELFRALERVRIGDRLRAGFVDGDDVDVDGFISYSLSVQNRRKARMGRSLEGHLQALFVRAGLRFDAQATTEGRRRPDFLFPGAAAYHAAITGDPSLTMLAAKSTCKDRWRQILNEAAKIPVKHLCTLEPAISANQLDEMQEEGVVLVVPARDHAAFDKERQRRLVTVADFMEEVGARSRTALGVG